MWVLGAPAGLVAAGLPMPEHWKVYLPAVLLSFTVMVPAVIMAEKKVDDRDQPFERIKLMSFPFWCIGTIAANLRKPGVEPPSTAIFGPDCAASVDTAAPRGHVGLLFPLPYRRTFFGKRQSFSASSECSTAG